MPRGSYYHYSPKEKIDLINEYYESGLSANKYCKLKKLYPTTFGKWIKKYQASVNLPEAPLQQPGFLDVTNDVMVTSRAQPLATSSTPPALLSTGMTEQKVEKPKTGNTTNRNDIKLKTPNGFELCFDISIIKEVLEAIS